MEISGSPNLPDPEAVYGMVVYDPTTGAILHRHIAVRYPGGHTQQKHELEARVLELAAALGIDTKVARVLQVDPADAFAEGVECRVDVDRQILVPRHDQSLTYAELCRRSARLFRIA